jgi:hypothetical protein
VHAMTTPERHALVARFHERNPTASDSPWKVNEDALDYSVVVVDPFKGFLRRARRDRTNVKLGPVVTSEEAVAHARAFVQKNADLLGLSPLPGAHTRALAEQLRPAPATSSGREIWVVHFDGRFPSKGYEAFAEIDNTIDLDVGVDEDGEVSSLDNRSRVHPRLTLDLRPRLPQDDPRVFAHLVGRRVFALIDVEGAPSERQLEQLPLGEVQAEDVARVKLVIHQSTGPRLAWLTYRLAYFVEVAKRPAPGVSGVAASPVYFFRYVVDVDTGEVIEDSRAPVVVPP